MTTETMPHQTQEEPDEFRAIPIDRILPSFSNPRKHFDQEALEELSQSIRAHGILEPLIVCPVPTEKDLDRAIERWGA